MKVGSFVICVDDTNWSSDVHENFNKLPVKGQLYIVSEIHPNYASKEGPPGVSVEGIVGKMHTIKTYWGQRLSIEWHFKIRRFKEIELLSNSVELIEEVENEEQVIETEAELIK
jgi:hypothetical protein